MLKRDYTKNGKRRRIMRRRRRRIGPNDIKEREENIEVE